MDEASRANVDFGFLRIKYLCKMERHIHEEKEQLKKRWSVVSDSDLQSRHWGSTLRPKRIKQSAVLKRLWKTCHSLRLCRGMQPLNQVILCHQTWSPLWRIASQADLNVKLNHPPQPPLELGVQAIKSFIGEIGSSYWEIILLISIISEEIGVGRIKLPSLIYSATRTFLSCPRS